MNNNLPITKENLQLFLQERVKTDKSFKKIFNQELISDFYIKTDFLINPNRRPPYNKRARIEERIFCYINNILDVPKCPITKVDIFQLNENIVLFNETLEDLFVNFPYHQLKPIDMSISYIEDKNYYESKLLDIVDNTIHIGKDKTVTKIYRKAVYMNWVKIYLHLKGIDYTKMSADEALFFIKNRLIELPKCPITGEFLYYRGSGEYNQYASMGAAFSKESDRSKKLSEHRQELLKTDKKGLLDKVKHTFQQKYGCDYGLQSKAVKEKIKLTMIERYGVRHPSLSKEINEKKQNTFLQKHGGNPYSVATETKRINAYNKILQLTNVKPLFSLDEFRGTGAGSLYKWLDLNNNKEFFAPYYCSYGPITDYQHTAIEQSIINYLEKNKIEYKFRDRNVIAPLELDLYIPKYNLAIETHGMYFHSTCMLNNKHYHFNKFNLCKEKGVRLIQIFEDEIRQKSKIIQNRLNHIFKLCKYKVYGRNCEIRQIEPSLKDKFLDKYHLQGTCQNKVNLGAFYKNRLVAVMTFSQNRISISQAKDTWELTRFATLGNFTVIGIANKLFQHFLREYNQAKLPVITFSDLCWGEGNIYKTLGFDLVKITKPGYFYSKNLYRFHRFSFRKSELSKKLENFDPNKSETENMIENGYLKIYNAGNAKYIYKYLQ